MNKETDTVDYTQHNIGITKLLAYKILTWWPQENGNGSKDIDY
jgi:hypothetical protein